MKASAAPVAPSGPQGTLPAATAWSLLGYCLAGMGMIWLPLAVLQQVDALRAFMTWREIGRDVALLLVLLTGISAVLTGLAIALAAALRGLGARRSASDLAAWLLVSLPITVLCAGQFAYGTKRWIELALDGPRLAIAPVPRAILVLSLPLLLLLLWRWKGPVRLVRGLVEPVMGLRPVAALAVAMAAGYLVWQPPPIGDGRQSSAIASRPPAAPGAPDIFLITLDALAAEDAGLCGDGPTSMPRLRELARRSTCFTRFYAGANFTNPATSTIDTGTLPWTHWSLHIGGHIAPPLEEDSIGHALQRAGYTTHFVGANLPASPRQHGTYHGYDSIDVAASTSIRTTLRDKVGVFRDSSIPMFIYAVSSFLWTVDIYSHGASNPYPPESVYSRIVPLLQRLGRARPSFVWAHTLPPHAPYLPPPSTKYTLLPAGQLDIWREFLADNLSYAPALQPLVDKHRLRYREAILGADLQLGQLLDSLDREGRLDGAMVVVTADHGESFERGFLGHAGEMLHEAVIRIPLLVKLPGQKIGRIVTEPAGHADLASTLIDFGGGQALPHGEGRSLRPALLGQPQPAVPVFSMTMERESRFRPLRGGHYTVIDGRYKYVYHLAQDRGELYDLDRDAHEMNDLSTQAPETAARLRTLLRAKLAAAEAQRSQWFDH